MDSILGIALGMAAAFFQAISYSFSGLSIRRYKYLGTVGILARSMLIVGILGALMLPFAWSPEMNGQLSRYLPLALVDIVAFLFGQAFLFMAQRTIDASSAVPFLGMKLVFLAIINSWIVRTAHYDCLQWLAVVMTIFSAFLLSQKNKSVTLSSFCWLVLCCASYSCSDTYINKLTNCIKDLGVPGDLRCAMLSAFISYIVAGIFSIMVLPFVKRAADCKVWIYTSYFGTLWMLAMMCLYGSIAKIGTVHAGIAQSTRGIMVVILGAILAKMGITELEQKADGKTVFRRLAAALLMVLSLILFNFNF